MRNIQNDPGPAPAARPSSSRLPGVDGLRALAALWVVLFHMQAFSAGQFRIPGLNLFLRSGSTGVSLFLVLSGFCLYIPFSGGRQGRFRTREFFVRRCRRLLPAYYTSLLLVVTVYILVGSGLGFHPLSAPMAVWQFLTHALLIHTLFPDTFYQLNGAYWSLGLEWELYLTLPVLIWGIRRFGIPRTLSVAVGCNVVYGLALALAEHLSFIPPHGQLATYVLPNQLPGRWAEFVLGMVAAELYTAGRIHVWARRSWWMIPLLVPIAFAISGLPLSHMVYGGVFFSLLSLVLASNNFVSKVASWRPLVAIGIMSYSLYLVHQPIVQGLAYAIPRHFHTTPSQTFVVLIALLPAILFAGWLLFITVERRTLTASRPTSNASPAPGDTASRDRPIEASEPTLHRPGSPMQDLSV